MNTEDYYIANAIRIQIAHLEETLETLDDVGNQAAPDNEADYNEITITGVGNVYLSDDDFAFIFKAAKERMQERIKTLELEFSLI